MSSKKVRTCSHVFKLSSSGIAIHRNPPPLPPSFSRRFRQFNEEELLDALAFVRPVSIAYEVAPDFALYLNGVYSSTVCRSGAQVQNLTSTSNQPTIQCLFPPFTLVSATGYQYPFPVSACYGGT